MVVKYLGDNEWEGLSTDTKPTTAANGARLIEINTGIEFYYNGSNWIQSTAADINTPNYIIYKAGSTIKRKNGLTGAVDSGSDFKTVVNDAITACPVNESHTIYIVPATYDLTGQINIKNYTRLISERMRMHEDTFSGTMLRKDASFTSGTMIGAADTGSANLRQPLVKGLSFYGVDQSVDAINLSAWMGRFEDNQMYQCNRAVFLQGVSVALDDNRIYGNRIHECDRGIEISTFMSASDIWSNVIGKCDKDGILVRGFSHRIYFNKVYECSRQGAGFTGISISALGDYSQIVDNQIEPDGNNMNCISISQTNNAIVGRNRCKTGEGLAGRFGIIVSGGSNYNKIIDNRLLYNSVAGTIYGIDIRDTSANNDLINNDFGNFIFSGGDYSPTARTQGNMIHDNEARSSASDPTTSNIRDNSYQIWKNTTSGAVKLWYNDAGTMKSVTLS